jgi:type II secretory ATPase GspE/PulE/Tfp pilus assembly ATPase PilB-like protein
VRVLDRYLKAADAARASDLHLEPCPTGLRVRVRVDGMLHELEPPPAGLVPALLTRLRLLAHVDLAEHRVPQDGRFLFANGEDAVEIRAAFMPVHGGEKVALRLLPPTRALSFDNLGLDPDDAAALGRALDAANGMIVVAGPTGSGKTTTLYACLERLRDPRVSIVTVEDPVERRIDGVAQIAVDEECGRSFARVLRSILRLDPDVIMIGEMRDTDSARIACRAALTGHRVLTTLHTADTHEAPVRLGDMGVPEYLVAATLSLVVAQRLLPTLCERCATEQPIGPRDRDAFASAAIDPPRQLRAPRGCAACNGEGFRGRTAVFELLDLRSRAPGGAAPRRSLLRAALSLAAAGKTTVGEAVARCPAPPR